MAVTQLVDLEADVLPWLDMTSLPADGGAKLQGLVDGVTPVIEDMVGRVVSVSVGPEIHDGGDTTIYLREPPILSVDSITEVVGIVIYTLTLQPVGQPVDNFGFTVDDYANGCVVRRSAGSQPFPFYDNVGNVTVTYTAGRASVPPNVRTATLELIRACYQYGQQSYGRASSYVPNVASQDDDMEPVPTPSGFLVPKRVWEYCQATPRPLAIG